MVLQHPTNLEPVGANINPHNFPKWFSMIYYVYLVQIMMQVIQPLFLSRMLDTIVQPKLNFKTVLNMFRYVLSTTMI